MEGQVSQKFAQVCPLILGERNLWGGKGINHGSSPSGRIDEHLNLESGFEGQVDCVRSVGVTNPTHRSNRSRIKCRKRHRGGRRSLASWIIRSDSVQNSCKWSFCTTIHCLNLPGGISKNVPDVCYTVS